MNNASIQTRVDELGPWVNAFEFGGNIFGDRRTSATRPQAGMLAKNRSEQFRRTFPHAQRILELGTLEGSETVRLASQHGTHVVTIEGRIENIQRAKFIAELHDAHNIDFVLGDIEGFDFQQFGHFDAVMCSGVLYHMTKPLDLVETLSLVADGIFVRTHYWCGQPDSTIRGRYAAKYVREEFAEPQLRGLRDYALWLTRPALMEALSSSGFPPLDIHEDEVTGNIGDITLSGRKAPSGK
jgi:SAM-dependent methyltransferase